MATVLKVNHSNFCRMLDESTGELIRKYDPNNQNLIIITELEDGSELKVKNSQIEIEEGGYIVFEYNGEKYIIDDGYRDSLLRAGYIVDTNYSAERIQDNEKGVEVRNNIMTHILDVLEKSLLQKAVIVDNSINHITVKYSTDTYNYTISFCTINCLVSKNQERTKAYLPNYPFNKDMDKYSSIYFTFFAEKINEVPNGNRKFEVADALIYKLMQLLNESEDHFRYIPTTIKRKLINWEGL